LKVPDVRAGDEILCLNSKNGDSHGQEKSLEGHMRLVRQGI
jgi:hypothetical protein